MVSSPPLGVLLSWHLRKNSQYTELCSTDLNTTQTCINSSRLNPPPLNLI